METILLASSSLRRIEMLTNLGLPFIARSPEIDESLRDELAPRERVLALAEDKTRAAAQALGASDPRLVLGADTLVCLPSMGGREQVMGKPENREDAHRMIEALAGSAHFVHTGIALLDRDTDTMRTVRSDSLVRFSTMTSEEIERYLETGEWEGVAGAYRIQGAAAFHIAGIEGSWSGIVGLPLRELYVILSAAGYRFRSFKAE